MNYGWELAKIAFYLLLIIGIIYLLSYPFKRKILQGQSSRYMNVIDRLYYDSKSSFILLKIDDEIILLAQSEGKTEKLSSWKQDELDLDIDISITNKEQGNKLSNFKKYFIKYINRNKGDRNE